MLPTYQHGDAARYAESQGWAYKRSGDELVLKQCPFCSKTDKLYWNDASGAFDCKSAVCGKSGNYFTLRRDLGDPVEVKGERSLIVERPKKKTKTFAQFVPFEKNLEISVAAQEYLAKRGITLEQAKKWHIGTKHDPSFSQHKQEGIDGPIDWLMIPYITRQGTIADVKYRTIDPAPKRFKRLGGGDLILFGEHLLPESKGKKKAAVDTIYLCEGELDAITLDQHGFSPALSTTCGAGTFPPRWYDLIVSSGAKKIVLLYDSDVDGQTAAAKLAKKFADADREVINVVLEDAKDANEYLQKYTAEDLRLRIQASRPLEYDYCLSAATVLDELVEQLFMSGGQLNGYPSKHQNLNELIDGGYWKGCLITVVGGSGTGKTTFVMEDLINIGTNYGPVYMCCLEMPPTFLMRKTINHLYHIPTLKVKQHHIDEYRADIERRNLFFGKGIRNVDQLAEAFIKAHKRYDLKAIAFDNIHYLCRDPKNQSSEISNVTKRLKELAMELDVPIIAIAQPAKFDRAERIINENDVKGSSSIEQDSDYMFLMWRPTLRTDIDAFGKTMGEKENMSPLTYIRVGKARYTPGGETLLYYHGDISTFRALSEAEKTQLLAEAAEKAPEKGRGKFRGANK